MSHIPEGFIKAKQAREILGIDQVTLVRWTNNGNIPFIRAEGERTHRRYNVKAFIEAQNGPTARTNPKKSYCYCRVSTRNQKDDLIRQVEWMRERYPNHSILTDIGSGLNFKRKGLQKLIGDAIDGEIEEVVVAYKDRLCRFGFELIDQLISKYSGGRIVVLKQTISSPQEELVTDLLSIITVFSSRIHGLRKYKHKI